MATTDSNGLVILQDTDDVSPLQTAINTVTASISTYLTSNKSIKVVANTSVRNALAASYLPTVSNPLIVWRTDATAGRNIEYTTDGVTWSIFLTPQSLVPTTAIVPVDSGATGMTGSITAYKDINNIVTLYGSFGGSPTVGSPVGSGFTLCTLPPGFRPGSSFKTLNGSSSSTNNNVRLLGFAPSGVVTVIWSGGYPTTAGSGGSNAFMDGITYRAA